MKEYSVSYQDRPVTRDYLKVRLEGDQNVTIMAEEAGGFFIETDPKTAEEIQNDTDAKVQEA